MTPILIRRFADHDGIRLKKTSLFLKREGGAGEGKNFFSREKKFFLSPASPALIWNRRLNKVYYFWQLGQYTELLPPKRTETRLPEHPGQFSPSRP